MDNAEELQRIFRWPDGEDRETYLSVQRSIEQVRHIIDGKDVADLAMLHILYGYADISELERRQPGFLAVESFRAIWDDISSHFSQSPVPKTFEAQVRSRHAMQILGEQDYFIYGRGLYTTENKRLLLAPDFAKIGDVVAVLFGGYGPYILRPVPNTNRYQYVGDTHVHGLMNGEAAEGLTIEDFGEIEIV
jgi:acid phosphatase class B